MITLTDELRQYCADVLADKPLTCTKHKQACQRFLDDLDRVGTDEFPYVFSEERAERFLDWMRLFKHRDGILAGKKINPEPIQKFVFGNLYGWIHKDTGRRRFTKFYWQVARKNAKSQSLALMCLYELLVFPTDTGEATQVYTAAVKKEQASIIYEMCVDMLKGCKALKGKYKEAYKRLTHLKSNSFMRALSKEDRKTGDGFNPQCGVIDEYHAHETTEMHDIIDSGQGARPQPILGIITTAGFDLSNPCYRVEYDLVTKILDPNIPINLDHYFCIVNELERDEEGHIVDDIKDPNVWIKANPIVCTYSEGIDKLQKDLDEALLAPEKMRNFLTKRMNVWIMQRECGYMNMAKWAACKTEPMPDTRELATVIGLDLSSRIDLCSVACETQLKDGTFAVTHHSFMPAEIVNEKKRTDSMPYDIWIDQGYITATPGSEVDYHFILDWVAALYDAKGWRRGEACFDRALATWLTHEMTELGFTAIDVPQSYTGLSEATKDVRAKAYNKKIVHDGDPVLTWAMSNCITRSGPSENIMLDKGKARQRIDPVAALINAHTRTMVIEPVEKSVYSERGMRIL